jgi:hypothetical protein
MKTSFLKKLRLFLSYRKSIKANKVEIQQKFGFRIDNANRLYTVLNIPEELVGEAYSLKKSDIDTISQNFIREFLKESSSQIFLDSLKVSINLIIDIPEISACSDNIFQRHSLYLYIH